MSEETRKTSRRNFLKVGSASLIGISIGSLFPGGKWLENEVYAVKASEGYLLVDTKKCQGCSTCMMACSLAHHGKSSLSLARIQVQQNPYKPFPEDLDINQCRQCAFPACAAACPTGALHADKKNGNVRLVSYDKCIGCQKCMEACPYEPARAVWNHEDKHAQKCDLCVNTPFWKQKGGPDGLQACVEVCPLDAIKFTKEIPAQAGESGYNVNLRGEEWAKFGWTTE
ncbi:4Fe-4S dicluster domain-containing protein [Bacillus sp. FJAT-29814]|uniref:4Fe-4S dicluster domain-containing protein n=1 Tax=Bacillus sp. FJAT-29814 TaxID=1729688 RepID=UPI0008346DA2|nr:4Fe-4S dicluster domain-containing protein [Bacillus sp. FJAT-29814]